MKACDTCKVPKPDASFQPKGDGSRRATCRRCRRSKQKAGKPTQAPRPKRNPNQCWCGQPRATAKTKCQQHLDEDRIRRTAVRLRIRTEVIAHYGGKCAYCGNDEPIFLTIDHIPGGGNTHRKQNKEPNICLLLYKQKRAEGQYPKGYQVLCWSCNSAKHFHGEEAVKAAVLRLKSKMSHTWEGTRRSFEKGNEGQRPSDTSDPTKETQFPPKA